MVECSEWRNQNNNKISTFERKTRTHTYIIIFQSVGNCKEEYTIYFFSLNAFDKN